MNRCCHSAFGEGQSPFLFFQSKLAHLYIHVYCIHTITFILKWSAILFGNVFSILGFFFGFLVSLLCFPAFPCSSAFLLFCFSLLLPASLLLCFSAFPCFSLLLCFSASLLFCFSLLLGFFSLLLCFCSFSASLLLPGFVVSHIYLKKHYVSTP